MADSSWCRLGIGHGYSVGGCVARVQMTKDTTFFGEIDVPIRFSEDDNGTATKSMGLAVVFGLGF